MARTRARSHFERYRDEMLRQHPELDRPGVYPGLAAGHLPVDPATGTAAGVDVEDPARGRVPAIWTPGRRYLLGQDRETGRWGRYVAPWACGAAAGA